MAFLNTDEDARYKAYHEKSELERANDALQGMCEMHALEVQRGNNLCQIIYKLMNKQELEGWERIICGRIALNISKKNEMLGVGTVSNSDSINRG